jgi:hypothetical protein
MDLLSRACPFLSLSVIEQFDESTIPRFMNRLSSNFDEQSRPSMGLRWRSRDILPDGRLREKNDAGLGAIVVFQHTLGWTATYVLASEIYMLATDAITNQLLPTAIVLLLAVS